MRVWVFSVYSTSSRGGPARAGETIEFGLSYILQNIQGDEPTPSGCWTCRCLCLATWRRECIYEFVSDVYHPG